MYSEEIRNNVLNEFIKGKSIKEISEEKKIAISTLHKWLKLWGYNRDTRDAFHEIIELLQKKDYETVIKKCDSNSLNKTRIALFIKEGTIKILKNRSFIWVDLTEIRDLFKKKKYYELLDKYQLEKYDTNYNVQLYIINSLIELGRLENALEICNRSYFTNFGIMQNKKITLYILLAKKFPNQAKLYLEKGLEVCNRALFKSDFKIQYQKNTLNMLLAKDFPNNAHLENSADTEPIKEVPNPNFSKQGVPSGKRITPNVREIFTKIYANVATIEMIEEALLSEFQTLVLMIMYYEKYNKAKAISFVKEKIANCTFSKEQIKLLKALLENLKSKKTIFDYGIYAKILHVEVDLDLYNKILKADEAKSLSVEALDGENASESLIIRQTEQQKVKPMEKKIISSKQQSNASCVVSPLTLKVKQKKDKRSSKREKKETLKEMFSTEYKEILNHVFCKLYTEEDQKRTLEAFDRLLLLGERAYDDIYKEDKKTGEIIKCGEVFDRVVAACYTVNNHKRVRKNWK